jgi:outer membrane protein assembly factor BamB
VFRAHIASIGTILWEVKFNKNYTIGTIPTVADDTVVIGFLDNPRITALSTDNGKILWNFTTDSPVLSSPAYSSNYFYFGSTNGVVYAVSKDGKELWHTKLGSNIETTPAVAFGKVFVGADDGNLYVLNATSGKLVWKYSTKGPITASPIVSINGIVYVGSTDGKIYALNAENGGIVWNDNTNASIEVTPVLDNGMLFVASSNGIIRAYYTANMPNNTLSTATTTGTKNATATQTVTNTQIATQSITTARVITSTVPTTATVVTYITTIIMERSWLSEEIIALAIILISAIIGLWLRRRWGKI